MDRVPIAIIDTCVLYSAPVRDLIVRLAQAGLLHARWTDDIHDEWIRNILKNRPQLARERLVRTRSLMDGAVRDGLVTGYEDLVDSLTLPDEDDRHVLAAAIRAGAGLILTFNLWASRRTPWRHMAWSLVTLIRCWPNSWTLPRMSSARRSGFRGRD